MPDHLSKEAITRMHGRHDNERPTPTIENYLKAICLLEDEDGLVRPTEIAEAMGVSAPTVTVTLRRIQEAGWVERIGNSVRLTSAGFAHASSVTRRRDVSMAFLEKMLGLPHDVAVHEACVLEHALSQRAVDALEHRLAALEPGTTTICTADGAAVPELRRAS
ncbi:MAG: metal-dependent transcriptional regulator [Coriobacteriia bacterium]